MTSGDDKTVRIWNAADGKEVRKIDTEAPATCVAISANGAQIAVGGADNNIRTYNFGDGKPLTTLSGHRDNVTAVDFSRDLKRIVSSSADGTVRVWDLASGRQIQHYVHHQG